MNLLNMSQTYLMPTKKLLYNKQKCCTIITKRLYYFFFPINQLLSHKQLVTIYHKFHDKSLYGQMK